MSQPFCLSAQARYATWNMSITIFWNGYSGARVMVIGSRSWLGVIVSQVKQLALKLQVDAFMPSQ